MTYYNDDMDWADRVKEAATGLEPYCGRPTPGNKIINGYLASSEKSLNAIMEAIFDMNRAISVADRARLCMKESINAVASALGAHFATQGGWDERTATDAVSNFEKRGFTPNARKFVAFIRGMFFDDSDKAFQAIRCIGLSSDSSRLFAFAGGEFEDSASGNQFELMLPFTGEKSFRWQDWSESFDFKLRNMPYYVLNAPDDDGMPQAVAKSYDIREMRVAVSKFVKGGCLYRHGQKTWLSYRIPDSFY